MTKRIWRENKQRLWTYKAYNLGIQIESHFQIRSETSDDVRVCLPDSRPKKEIRAYWVRSATRFLHAEKFFTHVLSWTIFLFVQKSFVLAMLNKFTVFSHRILH